MMNGMTFFEADKFGRTVSVGDVVTQGISDLDTRDCCTGTSSLRDPASLNDHPIILRCASYAGVCRPVRKVG
jgi:hypothetical protein